MASAAISFLYPLYLLIRLNNEPATATESSAAVAAASTAERSTPNYMFDLRDITLTSEDENEMDQPSNKNKVILIVTFFLYNTNTKFYSIFI